ncbi:MAG: CHAT domain-containing protein, partial [Desulfobacula sp.]|nr:CHAT domain-containing protein [Desulfobacula sp.]
LSYLLMRENVILFALTRESRHAVIIPYQRDDFKNQIIATTRQLTNPANGMDLIAENLINISGILIDGVSSLISEKSNIIVLLDGILNALPFDLLSMKSSSYQPLILKKSVMLSPSLRYIVQMRGEEREAQPASGLFAVADPVYNSSQQDLSLSSLSNLRGDSAGISYLRYFESLPETRQEVNSISTFFKNEPVMTLISSQATESKLKKIDLRPYKVLHFATHGILGDDLPMVSEPALVMSHEPGEDGFFTASEAADLELDAELTILSACNTGIGEYFVGEGLMSLSRSFLLAGSRKAIVSLWSVHSQATMNLMIAFYKHYTSGLEPYQALRKAKLDMMSLPAQALENDANRGIKVRLGKYVEKSRSSHPFYWAAFILIGS